MEVSGKGLGCVAGCVIHRGELILREKPTLLLEEEGEEGQKGEEETIKAFLCMSQEEQQQYLELANMFSKDKNSWPNSLHCIMKAVCEDLENVDLTDIDLETAVRVVQIKETNTFHNGVFPKMSRFNHSCSASAEYFWNWDLDTRDVRAIRDIMEGEEITLNYREEGYITCTHGTALQGLLSALGLLSPPGTTHWVKDGTQSS